jgi:membrane protease YdiL (CAAX protease family)
MEYKVYPTIKNAILLCLLLIGSQLVLGLIIGIFQLVFNLSDASSIMGILYILTSIISFGIVLLIGFKKSKRKFNEIFKFNGVSLFLWISTIIFSIGLVIILSELDNILNFILPMPAFFSGLFDALMADKIFIISLIYIGIIPAFFEELFFRGLILDGLSSNYSKRKAIIISALLFGIIHLNPWQFLTGFIIGLIMAWICIETRSLLLCIYIHFFNNVLYTLAVRYRDIFSIKGFNSNFETPGEFQPLWLTISGLALLSVGTIMLIKSFKKAKTIA